MCTSVTHALDHKNIKDEKKGIPFTEWAAQYPQEKQLLGLFRDYQEPEVTYVKNGAVQTNRIELTMYILTLQFTVNKPASSINLPSLITKETIEKLDPETEHKVIQASETMPAVAGRGPVPNYKWCKNKDYYKLPDLVLPLDHLKKGDHAWCSQPGRATCFESCYPLSQVLRWFIGGYNKRKPANRVAEHKDKGMAMQSEVRYFTNETEFGMKLAALTGINTPVRGIVETNMFYVNQILQYVKSVSVFQEDPRNPQQIVITTFTAAAVPTSTWSKDMGVVGLFLMGKAAGFNETSGIAAGIPTFAIDMAKSMKIILEKN